ncbi:MAG: DivIVA domain-containing protein [Firmicutes bacterium]|nr:DivIVA domain-containing protein [Bacillota bacterium]
MDEKTKLTPVDIQHKKFGHAFRGYSEEEVDEFLDNIVSDFEEALQKNKELKEQIELLKQQVEKYSDLEDSIQNTLVMAQKNAEQLLETKKKEAGLVIKEAEVASEKMLGEAREKILKIHQEISDLKQERNRFLLDYKTLLKSHLSHIEELKLEELSDNHPPQ